MVPEFTSDISVIVPTFNSEATIRACLESIKMQVHPSVLVVVDNWSSDKTAEIARGIADIFLEVGPERSAQRNRGAQATNSPVVGFIDSDMVLSPGVIGEVASAIKNGAASVIVPETTVGQGYWSKVRAYERSFYGGVDDIEAPRFFRREVFENAGGFDENMTGAEDWDLGIRTRCAGPIARTVAIILHDEGRVDYLSLCRKKAYYAPGLALFVRKHGISRLTGILGRPWLKPRALFRPLGAGLILLKTGEAFAMTIVLLRGRGIRLHGATRGTLRP